MGNFVILFCCLFYQTSCIKIPAMKQSLDVLGQDAMGNEVNANNDGELDGTNVINTKQTSAVFRTTHERLKHHLIVERGYDGGSIPVLNLSNTIKAKVDFTPRQVLTLDEKRQVLRTFVHYRVFWVDEFLTWDPKDFDNITSLVIPSNILWRPDLVLYEDTSNWNYKPRISSTEVFHDGTVRYLEPIVFTTSCSINIAHFPFDYQICTLTFTSWTLPTSRFDLIAKRDEKELQTDIKTHLIKTGEWNLKESQSFAGLLTTSSYREEKFIMLDPFSYVEDVAPNRTTDLHWSEVIYVLHLRRNSSLYMQSMLFPAVLLTTIALLGFYLPPESGERIGLQITIMLTFMVFLLTVGEMFPASSTGPYLGIYYVMCMGLLGINLAMTVLVLFVHYMPVAQTMKTEQGEKGELVTITSPPPPWVRWMLMSACHPLYETISKQKGGSIKNRNLRIRDSDSDEKPKDVENCNARIESMFELDGLGNNQSENNNLTNLRGEITHKYRELKGLKDSLNKIKKLLHYENNYIKHEQAASKVDAEWKAMARVVDKICLKMYLALLILCHVAVLAAAMLDDNTIVDPLNKEL